MAKTQVEDCKSIDITWMRKEGFLGGIASRTIRWTNAAGEDRGSIGITVRMVGWDSSDSTVRLTYTVSSRGSDDSEHLDYEIRLTTTPCNFGGERYWFICPLSIDGTPCGRRVGKLYLPPGGRYFGCRHCYNLTYKCQQEHDKRVDALLKSPGSLLHDLHRGKSPPNLVAIRALFKVLDD
jgi:hypothetical protein